jgi:hypothetical protein
MATIVVGGLALDANNRLVEIDVGPGERERLADTEAGKGDQHEGICAPAAATEDLERQGRRPRVDPGPARWLPS